MAIIFYKHKNYFGERVKTIDAAPVKDTIKIYPKNLTPEQSIRKYEILAWFDTVTFEHVGVLQGEYLLLPNGIALLDRNGMFIAAGTAEGDPFFKHFDNRVESFDAKVRGWVLDKWDHYQGLDRVVVASDRYISNYWHFSTEFIPRFRFYKNHNIKNIAIQSSVLNQQNAKSMLVKSVGADTTVVPVLRTIRVRNPVLAFSSVSEEGITWLRNTMNISVKPGANRIYIRRSSNTSRYSQQSTAPYQGGIVEDENFMNFLKRFDFHIVDFGNGVYSIDEQVKMLEGAQIILSSHGAQLTNILYLNTPLSIIELLGPAVYNACYLSISNKLSFDYYGVLCDLTDPNGNILVDCTMLNEIMAEVTEA